MAQARTFPEMVTEVNEELQEAGERAVVAALEKDGNLHLEDLGEVVDTLVRWALHKSIDAETVTRIWLDGNLPEQAWNLA